MYNDDEASWTINNSNNRISASGIGNGGTLELNNSSVVFASNGYGSWLDNWGTLKLTASSITAGDFWNDGFAELYNSQIRVTGEDISSYAGEAFWNYGDIKLGGNSSLTVDSGATGVFGIDSRFLIAGTNNVIKADELKSEGEWWWDPATYDLAYTPNLVFQVEGTDSTTDSVSIDAKISFVDSATWNPITVDYDYTYTKGVLEFQNVTVELSSAVYTNVKEAYFRDAVVSGNGASHVDFFFSGPGSGVKPGNAMGTFYGNNMTFTGSTVYIEVGSSDFDKIIASGKIEFLGNTAVVLLDYGDAADSFTMNLGGTNGIFQAAKGISVGGDALDQTTATTDTANNKVQFAGTSGSVALQSNDFTFTDAWIDENGNAVFSVGGGDTPKPPAPGVSNNVRTLTNAVTKMQLKGGNALTNAIAGYAGASQSQLVEALNELDPVGLSLADIFVQNAVSKFNRTNYDRLRYLQNLYGNGNGTYRGQDCNPCDPCSVFGRKSGRELWFQGLADWMDQKKTDINGYSADTYGFALGIDSRVSNRTVFGVGFGGSFTNAKMYAGLGNAKADSYLLSLYGSHKIDALTVSGTVGYAFSNLESNRFAPKLGGNAKGVRDAETVFAGIELARRFGNRNGYTTPFIAYDYVSYSEEAFKETGNLINMNVAKKNVAGHLQTLGVRFGREMGAFKPELTAGWLHDYGVGTVRTAGAFMVDNTVPFMVNGVSRHKDRALFGVKADVTLSPRTNLFVRYDGEWAKDYNTQYLSAGLGLVF